MGIKHSDQISTSHWRSSAETVGDMYRRRWELAARCRACGVVLLVDLHVIIRTRGHGFSLWNQHTPCRRVVFARRCRGVIDFEFKAPGMTQHRPLVAPDREPPP